MFIFNGIAFVAMLFLGAGTHPMAERQDRLLERSEAIQEEAFKALHEQRAAARRKAWMDYHVCIQRAEDYEAATDHCEMIRPEVDLADEAG